VKYFSCSQERVLSRLCPKRKAATNEQNAVDVWQLELGARVLPLP